MDTAIFLYCNAQGAVRPHRITKINENGPYIKGVCLDSGSLKIFRQDRVISHHDSYEEAEQTLAAMLESGEVTAYVPKPKPWEAFDVCFAGYFDDEKEELVQLAKSAGMTVRQDVTTHLSMLCCGSETAPRKIKRARENGAIIVNVSQFLAFLETGEVPVDDSVPCQKHEPFSWGDSAPGDDATPDILLGALFHKIEPLVPDSHHLALSPHRLSLHQRFKNGKPKSGAIAVILFKDENPSRPWYVKTSKQLTAITSADFYHAANNFYLEAFAEKQW
jgi:hypothetical protein